MLEETAPPRAQVDEFQKGLGISVAAHVILAVFFLIRSLILPADDMNSVPAVRVDLVALPDKIDPSTLPPKPTDPKQPEAKAPPKPEAAPPPPSSTALPAPDSKPAAKTPDALNLEAKKKQQEALNRLKSLEAMEKIKQETELEAKRQEALAAASRLQQGAAQVKGNVLAPGTELQGVDRLQHEEYKTHLDRHIKQYWQLPEWLAKKGFRAQALVKIDSAGRLYSKRIMKSSGNNDFDENVLETIDRAVPLPAPPEKFIAKVGTEGILIEFGQ